jgi:hypothetical protein
MSFNTINGSIAGQTFAERSRGIYAKSDLTFADPANEFRITGASLKKDGSRAGAVTRILQKDVTYEVGTKREQCVVTLNVSVPNTGSVSATEVDSLIADISEFLSADTVSRLLQGEA